jgi:nucleoside-diphosphate-sugar epimerase
MRTIGITGSEGLIGNALQPVLERLGYSVTRLDVRLPLDHRGHGDVCDTRAVQRFVAGCCGVVHLAGVSRVVWGERDPHRCMQTNAGGTANVVRAAIEARVRPWVLFASSREVYGEPPALPVTEDVTLRPINVYGESKVAAERIVLDARESGLVTGVVRLSNAYGSTQDHPDRVVPAFARAAALGRELRVDGADHLFDFTHVDDAARGIAQMVTVLDGGERALPPIHLLTGRGTTLRELAELAIAAGGHRARAIVAPPRRYDVARFVGDPARARSLLDWHATRSIEDGVRDLVAAFAREAAPDSRAGEGRSA